MFVIGELFDQGMATSIQKELRGIGVESELSSISIESGTVYRLSVFKEEDIPKGSEYFRVKMGLPGAPHAPDPEWEKVRKIPLGLVTKFVLGFSVGIFLLSFSPENFRQVLDIFFFNQPGTPAFSGIQSGEVWRVITPIFLHFGFLHILFNSFWMKDLGSLFEKEKGPLTMSTFILLSGGFSNVLQYLAFGERFGGLSGVVYALLGYFWVSGAVHSGERFRMPKRDLVIIIGWYVFCLSGAIPNIANVAHGAGLGLGMVWGLFPLEKKSLKKSLIYLFLAIFFIVGTYVIDFIRLNN